MASRRREDLLFSRGSSHDPAQRAAYHLLMRDVLGLEPAETDPGAAAPWTSFCFFTHDGRCVANVEASILTLVADSAARKVGALRSVAVDAEWRGQGLFRTLMTEALTWCDARSGLTLLYTADPALYRRFGFRTMAQHAFVGSSPAPRHGPRARRLSLGTSADAALLRAAIARRVPVSSQCALLADATLITANIAADTDLVVAFDDTNDALLVYEPDTRVLTVADIIAPKIPDLATVLGAIGATPRRIKVLFSPDRLDWSGEPVAEDTGLMVRGDVPPAMTRPFMFPPTVEF